MPKQAKKISKTVKERIEKLIQLHQNLHKLAKLVQEYIKKYYNQKVSKGLDFKKENKVYLLTKNFKSKQLSKKLNYIKMGPFKIINKVIFTLNFFLSFKFIQTLFY